MKHLTVINEPVTQSYFSKFVWSFTMGDINQRYKFSQAVNITWNLVRLSPARLVPQKALIRPVYKSLYKTVRRGPARRSTNVMH